MRCNSCASWLTRRQTDFSDGSTAVLFDGNGFGICQAKASPLCGKKTDGEFGCVFFAEGGPRIDLDQKRGSPWHHKTPIPCPDCRRADCGFLFPGMCMNPSCLGTDKCIGQGAKAGAPDETGAPRNEMDGRCCGTGTVLMYGDGFIGENKTKMHPIEADLGKRDETPKQCRGCQKELDPRWVICPFCETKVGEPPPVSEARIARHAAAMLGSGSITGPT